MLFDEEIAKQEAASVDQNQVVYIHPKRAKHFVVTWKAKSHNVSCICKVLRRDMDCFSAFLAAEIGCGAGRRSEIGTRGTAASESRPASLTSSSNSTRSAASWRVSDFTRLMSTPASARSHIRSSFLDASPTSCRRFSTDGHSLPVSHATTSGRLTPSSSASPACSRPRSFLKALTRPESLRVMGYFLLFRA